MSRMRNLKGLISVLTVIVILTTPLFLAACVQVQSDVPTATVPWATDTPLGPYSNDPTATRPVVVPTQTSVARGQEPPACSFPLAQVQAAQSQPEDYSFSAPQVVLTAIKGNIYHIAQWLPNSQQVLMTEELRHNLTSGNNNPLQESITLFNPTTGTSKKYATRTITNGVPVWLPDLNAIVYPAINYTSYDRKMGTSTFTRQVWVSRGDPTTVQLLDDNPTQFPLAAKPDGSAVVYLSGKMLSRRDGLLGSKPAVPLDLTQLDYSKNRSNFPVFFRATWQPGTSLAFLYSPGYDGGGGYTFVLNTDTGDICELNFEGSASGARWSSDGRYLAIGRATTSHPADLTVLDVVTGKLTTLGGTPQGIQGQLYVGDFTWAPDNRHLLAIGIITSHYNNQSTIDIEGMYLVDIGSRQGVYVGEYKNVAFFEGDNWAWSPDGSKLIMRCPTSTVDRLCLISVYKSEK